MEDACAVVIWIRDGILSIDLVGFDVDHGGVSGGSTGLGGELKGGNKNPDVLFSHIIRVRTVVEISG